MKGLPLWQPWATLVVIGAKRIETRHWPAPEWMIGQRVGIYATKTRDHLWQCAADPFDQYVPDGLALPLGAIVGTVVVARCSPMHPEGIEKLERERPHEIAFGHYAVGRYAWVLRNAIALDPAVEFAWPVKGPAKYIEIPDDLVGYEPPPPAQGALL